MADPNNFYLDSDYPMDKIVYFKSGSFTPSSGSVTFQHGLSYRPLLFGSFSKTEDFSTSYSFNVPVTESGEVGGFGADAITLLSDDSRVMMYIPSSVKSELSGTYYYRIFGFMPYIFTDSDYTSQNAENYIINSDYKYYKLYMSGEVDYQGSNTIKIHHGLGFIPYVLVWGDSMLFLPPTYPSTMQVTEYHDDHFVGEEHIKVDENDITITLLGESYITQFSKIYYRIYYDEA